MSTAEWQDTIQVAEDGFVLPLEKILPGRGFIMGRSGSGKSNTVGVLCEELLEKGYPFLIVDTDGEHYALKEKYQILHVGADEECDFRVGTEHAERLADLALKQNVPIVLDVSGFIETSEARELIAKTIKFLFDKEKGLNKPFPILVEEAHEYIPQKEATDECGKIMLTVAKRGRKRGLGLWGISQRPANVDKDYLTQCDWLVWHRFEWESDLRVVRDVLGSEYAEQMADFSAGEAFVTADWIDGTTRIRFKRKDTFDLGATPDLEGFERPDLKSVESELIEELESITEEQTAEENEIERLEQQLEAKEEELDRVREELQEEQTATRVLERIVDRRRGEGGGVSEEELEDLRAELEEAERHRQDLQTERDRLVGKVDDLEAEIADREATIEELEEYRETAERLEEWRERAGEAEEAYRRLGEALELAGADSEEIQRLRERVENQREKIQDLEEREPVSADLDEDFENAVEFLRDPLIQEEVRRVAGKTTISVDNFWKILKYFVEHETAVNQDLYKLFDLGDRSIREITGKLDEYDVLNSHKEGSKNVYSLNYDAKPAIRKRQREREELAELDEEFLSEA